MEIKIATTLAELEQAFHIREIVFVQEQHCPLEDEFDQYDHLDAACTHVIAYVGEKAVGTGRIRLVDNAGKLERICILKEWRQKGVGKEIIKALEAIALQKGASSLLLHGQQHAEGFYHRLGYETASDVFIEDGIPHLLMKKEV